jgi:hypothetical protein
MVSIINDHNAIVPRPIRLVDPCDGEVSEEHHTLHHILSRISNNCAWGLVEVGPAIAAGDQPQRVSGPAPCVVDLCGGEIGGERPDRIAAAARGASSKQGPP